MRTLAFLRQIHALFHHLLKIQPEKRRLELFFELLAEFPLIFAEFHLENGQNEVQKEEISEEDEAYGVNPREIAVSLLNYVHYVGPIAQSEDPKHL